MDKSMQGKQILLSIKPKYVERIRSGEKQWEYRKQIWANTKIITKIYIYETSPTQKIIGYFTPGKILVDKASKIWDKTYTQSGISREQFFSYFTKTSLAYAIKITNLHFFKIPKDPYELIKGFHAPQNFMYVNIFLEEYQGSQRNLTEFLGCKISKALKQDLEVLANKSNISISN